MPSSTLSSTSACRTVGNRGRGGRSSKTVYWPGPSHFSDLERLFLLRRRRPPSSSDTNGAASIEPIARTSPWFRRFPCAAARRGVASDAHLFFKLPRILEFVTLGTCAAAFSPMIVRLSEYPLSDGVLRLDPRLSRLSISRASGPLFAEYVFRAERKVGAATASGEDACALDGMALVRTARACRPVAFFGLTPFLGVGVCCSAGTSVVTGVNHFR